MPRPRRRATQLTLSAKGTHGGIRRGSGRKKGTTKVPHRRRPSISPSSPLHVTLRLVDGIASLRRITRLRSIRRSIRLAHKAGFRVIQYAVMGNHFHLIVEATDRRQLARGMQGLKVRLARGLNKLLGRSGSLFRERYHFRVLRTPRQVRTALGYVLNNLRRHAAQRGRRLSQSWVDPFSSAPHFEGWSARVRTDRSLVGEDVTAAPQTWLLRVGWKRGGLLSPDLVPGAG